MSPIGNNWRPKSPGRTKMTNERLTALLVKHEGLKLKPYKDTVGILTIGVGRNLEERGITQEEAMYLLGNDISEVRKQAAETFPWYLDLNQARRDVVTSMIFNLGLQGFLGFKETIKLIKVRDFLAASKEMLNSKWSSQVGGRSYELSEMMRTGQYLEGDDDARG